MLFAAMGNIRGDAKALNIVLEEMDSLGVQVIVNTGDMVGEPTNSPSVLKCLAEREIQSVQGALDRTVSRLERKRETIKKRLDPLEFDRLSACHKNISQTEIEHLGSLPKAKLLTFDGRTVALCHGTWNRQNRYLNPTDEDQWFRRQRELQPANVFVLGGSVGPFDRMVDDTLFVNPGSVTPDADGFAHFALINIEELPAQVEHRRVAVV